MELIKRETVQVREETYVIQHPKQGVLVYKEWLDTSGKVIDSVLRGKHGDVVLQEYEPQLVEEIWEFIDRLEHEQK